MSLLQNSSSTSPSSGYALEENFDSNKLSKKSQEICDKWEQGFITDFSCAFLIHGFASPAPSSIKSDLIQKKENMEEEIEKTVQNLLRIEDAAAQSNNLKKNGSPSPWINKSLIFFGASHSFKTTLSRKFLAEIIIKLEKSSSYNSNAILNAFETMVHPILDIFLGASTPYNLESSRRVKKITMGAAGK